MINRTVVADREGLPYDGFSEVWYDSMDDLKNIFKPSVLKEILKQGKEKNIEVIKIFIEEL